MYESKGSSTSCKLKFGFEVTKAYITDMLEGNPIEIELVGNEAALTFRPFEIVTLRIKQ